MLQFRLFGIPAPRAVSAASTAALAAAATLAVVPVAAAAGTVPTQAKATAGGVTATVTYERKTKPVRSYEKLRLTVKGPAGSLTKVTLPRNGRSFSRPRITLVDLNGDGVVDPIVDTFTGGAHCCSLSSIALSAAGSWAKPKTHFWGNWGYELGEAGGAPGPELLSRDDRFAYTFASYAASFPAIQIWAVRGGVLTDVTREFPDAIRGHVAEMAELYATLEKDAEAQEYRAEVLQSAAAAWIADLLLLGDLEGAKAVLARLAADGYAADDESKDPSGKGFTKRLVTNLVEWGYLESGAQLGL